ncbi:MAG: HPr family phosphocarrier protein [Oscillospiraceae bacterium]
MVNFDFTVTDENGLHARPAGQLVKEAAKFESTITIAKGEKTADLRRLFAIMGLAVKQNETISVKIDGPDEDEAAKFIKTFLSDNF